MAFMNLCRSISRLKIAPRVLPQTTPGASKFPQHHLVTRGCHQICSKNKPLATPSSLNITNIQSRHQPFSTSSNLRLGTLEYYHKRGRVTKREKKSYNYGKPHLKGVVTRVIIKKPKKPNSANRKCVRVRIFNGEEVTAYVPGEGHNLQEHSIVLLSGARMADLPGVRHRCVRGVHDLAHVKKAEK